MDYRYKCTQNIVPRHYQLLHERYSLVSGFDEHEQPNISLTSPILDVEKDVGSALSVADYLFDILNSSFYLLHFNEEYFGDYSNLPFEDIPWTQDPFLGLRIDEIYDNKTDSYLVKNSDFRNGINQKKPSYYDEEKFSLSKSKELFDQDIFSYGIYISRHSDIFEHILLLVLQSPDYVNLYKILESIKTHLSRNNVKHTEFYIECGFSKNLVGQFTETCNNHNLSGIKGRHGVTNKKSPNTLLSELDSKMMIHKMASHLFLNYLNLGA